MAAIGLAMSAERPGSEGGAMRGVSAKELGDAAASRLSRVNSASLESGAVGALLQRASVTRAPLKEGASLEDTVKQQAATIHAQALKLQQLQGLLDFALKQKSEEDVEDEKRVRQLEEIISFKDKANKDLKGNLSHLENALAETKMNLEFMHAKWRDEAAAHEQVLSDMKAQRSRMQHLEDEHRRQKEREDEANSRIRAARSEALDRVQELQEMQLRYQSTAASFDQHKTLHARIKERLSSRCVKLSEKGVKSLCFTHWCSRMERSSLKAQLMRALEKNWMARRMLLWRHQKEAMETYALSEKMEYEASTVEEQLRSLQAERDMAVSQVAAAEVELSEAREGLQNTILQNSDLVIQNENLGTQLRAYKARSGREDELAEQLKKTQFELRIVEEELRLAHDLTHAVRVADVSAEEEADRRRKMQDKIDAACLQLEADDVMPEERLDVLVALAIKCRAAQRDRDSNVELRQSLARQVADVTQQLAILEEENTLLRNLGLSSPAALRGASAAAYVSADALQDKDEAIAVLTQRARELEKKLEAVSSDLNNAMGQLVVTVIRARDLSGGDDAGALAPFVNVRVDKQEYKTGVCQGGASPEWNEDFAFSVSAATRELALSVVDWGGGAREHVVGTAVVMLSDLSFSLNEPHHAWVPLQVLGAGVSSRSEASSQDPERDMAGGGRPAVLLEIEYKGPSSATPRGTPRDLLLHGDKGDLHSLTDYRR